MSEYRTEQEAFWVAVLGTTAPAAIVESDWSPIIWGFSQRRWREPRRETLFDYAPRRIQFVIEFSVGAGMNLPAI
jgi:hypothetical protein